MRNLHSIKPAYSELQLAYVWWLQREKISTIRIKDGIVQHWDKYAEPPTWNTFWDKYNNNEYILKQWIYNGRPALDLSRIEHA